MAAEEIIIGDQTQSTHQKIEECKQSNIGECFITMAFLCHAFSCETKDLESRCLWLSVKTMPEPQKAKKIKTFRNAELKVHL